MSTNDDNNNNYMDEIDDERLKTEIESPNISRLANASPVNSYENQQAGTPGTPVDIKSVPQVRQLSCKKLIYSYTFGSNCTSCNSHSCSSTDSSPNIFMKTSVNRSPTSNCRQSLNSRFSSMAAERISSSRSGPSSSSFSNSSRVSKPRQQRRGGNDRGMDVDQVGNGSSSSSSHKKRNSNNQGSLNKNNRNNRNNNNNRPKPSAGKPKKSAPVTQSDLDKELESYMMKNSATAKNTLDMELDSYMSAAPSKA